MKTATYTTVQTATGGTGKYPMSTETLDFIQSQVLLLQQLSFIAGKKCVLKEPDGESTGIVAIDGEILTMAAKPILSDNIKYIIVTETTEDILADGETYLEARKTRTAAYSGSASGDESYDYSLFTNFAPNTTLLAQIKQMPQTVLSYLSDVLAEKLSVLAVKSATQSQLDGLTTPCLASFTKSVALFTYSQYGIMVTLAGDVVRQHLTLPNGCQYERLCIGGVWSDWGRVGDDLHIELKIVNGDPYIRHGYLPPDAKILLLRKKRRSPFRRTGGANSYAAYRGKRRSRSPKLQYVHYKGIVLSQGTPNGWYKPTCIAVENKLFDGDLIDKYLPSICHSLIYEVAAEDGSAAYRIQGTRVLLANGRGKGIQHRGYAQIAVQIAVVGGHSKEVGGEMARMRYNIWRKKETYSDGSETFHWERYFSIE